VPVATGSLRELNFLALTGALCMECDYPKTSDYGFTVFIQCFQDRTRMHPEGEGNPQIGF
jgi:hypothetical protein